MKQNKLQRGFTLVEIMIVVGIIGLLAAIAIPNLLRARNNANEGAIKSALRAFSTANESYRTSQATPTYAPDLASMTSSSPPFLDISWTAGVRNGFDLTYAADTAPAAAYSMLASPSSGSSLSNTYCVDQTGVVVVGASGVTGAGTGCSGGTSITA